MGEQTGHPAVDGLRSEATVNGSLAELGVLDLLQAIADTRRSAALRIRSAGQRADLFFRDGDLIDAELGTLRGERAVYAALTWSEGQFEVDFQDVPRRDAMRTSTRRVLWEGRRRLEERTRRVARLPDLGSVFEVDCAKLLDKLVELPDEMNLVLQHFDGDKPLFEILSRCELDELTTLSAFARLIAEGLIFDRQASGPSAAPGTDGPARGRPPPVISTLPPPRATIRSTLDYELDAQGREAATTAHDAPSPIPERPPGERTLRGMRASRVATHPPRPVDEPSDAIGDAPPAGEREDGSEASELEDASQASEREDASQASELEDGSEVSEDEIDPEANSRPTVRAAPPDAELYVSGLASESMRRRRRRRRRPALPDAPARRLRSFATLGPETALQRDQARSARAWSEPIASSVAAPVATPVATPITPRRSRALPAVVALTLVSLLVWAMAWLAKLAGQ